MTASTMTKTWTATKSKGQKQLKQEQETKPSRQAKSESTKQKRLAKKADVLDSTCQTNNIMQNAPTRTGKHQKLNNTPQTTNRRPLQKWQQKQQPSFASAPQEVTDHHAGLLLVGWLYLWEMLHRPCSHQKDWSLVLQLLQDAKKRQQEGRFMQVLR